MTHNQWADLIRKTVIKHIGLPIEQWPLWIDYFIYEMAAFLSQQDND